MKPRPCPQQGEVRRCHHHPSIHSLPIRHQLQRSHQAEACRQYCRLRSHLALSSLSTDRSEPAPRLDDACRHALVAQASAARAQGRRRQRPVRSQLHRFPSDPNCVGRFRPQYLLGREREPKPRPTRDSCLSVSQLATAATTARARQPTPRPSCRYRESRGCSENVGSLTNPMPLQWMISNLSTPSSNEIAHSDVAQLIASERNSRLHAGL
jgi:hypothetical protein